MFLSLVYYSKNAYDEFSYEAKGFGLYVEDSLKIWMFFCTLIATKLAFLFYFCWRLKFCFFFFKSSGSHFVLQKIFVFVLKVDSVNLIHRLVLLRRYWLSAMHIFLWRISKTNEWHAVFMHKKKIFIPAIRALKKSIKRRKTLKRE